MTNKPADLWSMNNVQFPRLIAELEANGAFTPEVVKSLCDSMDITEEELSDLIDRAQEDWEFIKTNYCS